MKVLVARVGVGSLLRVALALLVIMVAVVQRHPASVVPGALTLLVTELIPPEVMRARTRLAAGVLVASLTVGFSIVFTPAALPLLLLPAFRAGETVGTLSLLVERAATAGITSFALLVLYRGEVDRGPLVVPLVQWWTLGLTLGALAAVANRVQPASPEAIRRLAAVEAVRLSGRLALIARRLPLGLDAPAVAQTLLDDVFGLTTVDVGAVLLQVDAETASPLALRGATRLPWRDPIRSQGALHDAWTGQQAVIDVRDADLDGRRRGSSMLCLPLWTDRTMLALLVLERRTTDEFTPDEIARIQEVTELVAPQLHAALRFGELQQSATVFEREQLAREMHNGVAQDLAFVGFGLDALARHPSVTADLGEELQSLRSEVSRMLADIRLSIGDLRVGVRSDKGLGRVVSAQLQHFGATTGSAVQVELRESTVRLPLEIEQALARLTHELLIDARTGKASSVRVMVEAEPPMVTYLLEHDGASTWAAGERLGPALLKLGARLQVLQPEHGQGVAVIVHAGEQVESTPRFAVVPVRESLDEGIGA